MHKIELQPAYILHSRPYRETSLLLELFTREQGRFSAIAKGVRRQKSHARALLQPFVPLLVSCTGRGELLNLKHFEPMDNPLLLEGRRLISGFYINELLMRLLHRFDAHERLFHVYGETLQTLTKDSCEQITLRLFEKALLKDIGYELRLDLEIENGEPVSPSAYYVFDPERGPLLTEMTQSKKQGEKTRYSPKVYSGKSLLAFANETLIPEDLNVLRDVKHLMREALNLRLGPRPLETRKLL